jgi:hypothetical protein
MCLHCGHRLALGAGSGRSGGPGGGGGSSWRPAAVIALVLLALGAGVVGVAIGMAAGGGHSDDDLQEVRDNADQLVASAKARETDVQTRLDRAQKRLRKIRREQQSAAGSWPAGQSGYTVVLTTSSDEATAQQQADEATAAGIKEVGVLKSDDYGLGTGLYVVYDGKFDTNEEAEAELAEISGTYSGAYSQYVDASGLQ